VSWTHATCWRLCSSVQRVRLANSEAIVHSEYLPAATMCRLAITPTSHAMLMHQHHRII
jgi:hypothetical protein